METATYVRHEEMFHFKCMSEHRNPRQRSSALFFVSIHPACLRGAIWTPKVLVETLFSWRYDRNTIMPVKNFQQKTLFFTNQNIIKAFAKNWAKTKGPTIKIIKTNFEVDKLRTNLHL